MSCDLKNILHIHINYTQKASHFFTGPGLPMELGDFVQFKEVSQACSSSVLQNSGGASKSELFSSAVSAPIGGQGRIIWRICMANPSRARSKWAEYNFSILSIVSWFNHKLFINVLWMPWYILVWNTENKHYSLKPTVERAANALGRGPATE